MQFITEVNTIAVDNFDIGYSYNIRFRDDTLKTLVCIGKGVDFVMFQDKYPDLLFSLTMTTAADVDSIEVWSGGTTNYNDLSNKPQINSHTLFGNMSASDLGLVTPSDLSDYVTQDDLDDYVTQDDLDDYATTAAVTAALASKQDVINDLTDIRSGAAAGATAVQPAALNDYATTAAVTTALASKQDTLTTAQQTAVDSGITSALVTQIGTNENNISSVQTHFKSDDTRQIYISATAPSGIITDGSTWIDGKTIYSYTGTTLTNTEQGGIASADGQDTTSPSRVRTTFGDTTEQQGAHTISAGGDAQQVVVYVYDSSKAYLSDKSFVSWQNMPFRFNLDGDYYVRFVFRKQNDTSLSPSQVTDIVFKSWQ